LDWWVGLIDRLVVRVGVTLLLWLWLGSAWVWEAPAGILGQLGEYCEENGALTTAILQQC